MAWRGGDGVSSWNGIGVGAMFGDGPVLRAMANGRNYRAAMVGVALGVAVGMGGGARRPSAGGSILLSAGSIFFFSAPGIVFYSLTIRCGQVMREATASWSAARMADPSSGAWVGGGGGKVRSSGTWGEGEGISICTFKCTQTQAALPGLRGRGGSVPSPMSNYKTHSYSHHPCLFLAPGQGRRRG